MTYPWMSLSTNPKVVVNCSGIGARKLVGDKLVSPLRGQVSSLRTIFENVRSTEFYR